MERLVEKKFRTDQLSLEYRMRLMTKAAELREAVLNGETTDDGRILSIADELESIVSYVANDDASFRQPHYRQWA